MVLHSKSVVIFLEKYNTISKIKKLVMKVEGEKEFLLSMFDGEGWIGDKAIGISNNNKQLLLLCKKLLKNLGIESGKIYISTKKIHHINFLRQIKDSQTLIIMLFI